jgi:hypothetical protein
VEHLPRQAVLLRQIGEGTDDGRRRPDELDPRDGEKDDEPLEKGVCREELVRVSVASILSFIHSSLTGLVYLNQT